MKRAWFKKHWKWLVPCLVLFLLAPALPFMLAIAVARYVFIPVAVILLVIALIRRFGWLESQGERQRS